MRSRENARKLYLRAKANYDGITLCDETDCEMCIGGRCQESNPYADSLKKLVARYKREMNRKEK